MKTLRDWRRLRLLSIRALADRAGVAQKTVLDAEHGRTQPTLTTMRRLCKALEVDASDVEEFAAALGIEGKAIAA